MTPPQTPGAPQHFAIADMRRAITEARNRTGMIAGMPQVTVDASRLEYVLVLAEARQSALSAAAAELAEAARVLITEACPGTPKCGTGKCEWLTAEERALFAALRAYDATVHPAETGGAE